MSCSGCRVLRKGCSENCMLRQCLEWIDSPEAQANATIFVAKFFGRADLMAFISTVPERQRPCLFQSLLFEACGRTVNPVFGAVGLLWTGNWHVCQSAVETVLRGGELAPLPEFLDLEGVETPASEAYLAEEYLSKPGDTDYRLTDVNLRPKHGSATGMKIEETEERRPRTSPDDSATMTWENALGDEGNALRLFL
ncbi:hypothetical protein AAG906_012340 [Vitis piasezkii]